PGETGRAIVHPPRERGFHVLHKADAMQQYVIQMAAGPSGAWPERYAADLLTIVLGHPTGSRLYWEFVDTGEADSAVLSYGEYEGAGVFYSFLRCGPEKAEKNLARMVELFRRAEREGITAAELEQARNKVKSRFVLASERAGHRLFDLGDTWIHHNEYRSVRDELAGLDAVTLDDIAQVLRDYPLTALTTVTIGPLEKVAAPN
ncbi:MAG: insulinase family protein, partial [Planctomycetia bacterium]|nr:insulinase family protein [Planctomycetia bacterium]